MILVKYSKLLHYTILTHEFVIVRLYTNFIICELLKIKIAEDISKRLMTK